jgi:hypothetical protein
MVPVTLGALLLAVVTSDVAAALGGNAARVFGLRPDGA